MKSYLDIPLLTPALFKGQLYTKEVAVYRAGSGTLILGFPDSRTVRNKGLLRHPAYVIAV